MKSLMEYSGIGVGYLLGSFTFTGSFLRRARLFHPRGILYHAQLDCLVKEVCLPSHALVRLSQGIWKSQRWPDVLGFAFRLSEKKIMSTTPGASDQDLLFASFAHVWQLALSPFLSNYHFADNLFFAIAPFHFQQKQIELRLRPEWTFNHDKNRYADVDKAISKGEAMALIEMKVAGEKEWKDFARITLLERSSLDGEQLTFNPFLNGAGIFPCGFIQHTRIGAYGLSQRGRLIRRNWEQNYLGKENASPSSLPFHNPSAST